MIAPDSLRSCPLALLLTLPGLLVGCGDGSAPAWSGTVDTLAGGGLHVTSPDQGIWTEAQRWRLAEELRIGALESGGPDQFGSIADVTADPAGRIYVLEGQAQEVRVFGPDGGHIRTFGGAGGGPGELGQPLSLEWGPRGLIWIPDFGNRRYEIFDTAGLRLASRPFQGATFGFGNAFGPDGVLYERGNIREPEPRAVVFRSAYPSPDAEDLETIDTVDVPDEVTEAETVRIAVSQGTSTFRLNLPIPLTPRPRRELVPGEGWLLTEAVPAYRVTRLTFEGDTALIIERPYEPVPVTDSARQAAIEGLPGQAEVKPGQVPDQHPPFTSFEVAPGGELWVRRQIGPAALGYDIFSADGRYLGQLETEIPLDRLTVREIREDMIYGVLRDELDIPYAVRLRIQRPGAAGTG